MGLVDLLWSLGSALFGRGDISSLLAGLLLTGLALVINLYLRRKRLSLREGYNSKVAFVPDLAERSELFKGLLPTIKNVSSLIIRIKNTGRSVITEEDYLAPVSFTFENRFIVDFRVSEPEPDNIGTRIANGTSVSRWIEDPGDPPKSTINQTVLSETVSRLLPDPANNEPFTPEEKNARRQLTLPRLELKPGDTFKIAIDLCEDRISPDRQRNSKEYLCGGKIRSGKIVFPGSRRKGITLTRILGTICVLLMGGLIVTIFRDPTGRENYCVKGEMKIVGSSAFKSIADSISKTYTDACKGAAVTVVPTGSLEGLREVLGSGPSASSRLAALSDGKATGDVEALEGRQVALLIYSVVVNKDARIDNLSSEQIQGIYQGRYTNWHQLGSPVDLPIRLVSRGASSGSRQTFESYVLKFPENTLSSNSCIDKDRDPTAPIIRCERDSTNQVLDEVSRVPGAIGYADSVQVAEYPNVSGLRIDRRDPTVQYLPAGYPFWTIEYLYTDGVPTTGSVMNGYIDYISSDAARSRIHDAGYTPCVQADRRILDLCRTPR